ncbi:site-2 protease family protein [Sorangium sp. So ce321]|uniref:site-2 protease family protein n=1 Tax=Sorangium sp. So ce321 TaxID=3133300 RepID=UPI003F5EB095
MSFRLFGVSVDVQLGFWLSAALLGYGIVAREQYQLFVVWILVVFLSVLMHEFGHALAIKRHRVEPEITLHFMGGTTTWRSLLPLGRLQHVVISLAGPFAGFFVAGILHLLLRYVPALYALPPMLLSGMEMLIQVNVAWGVLNLIPVLPFDGGHVLEHALGPRRARLTAAISGVAAVLLAIFFLRAGFFFFSFILVMSAFQSLQRFRSEPEAPSPAMNRRRAALQDEPVPPETAALLQRARRAVEEERTSEAMALANEVLAQSPAPPKGALREAHELIGWSHLLLGDAKPAGESIAQARKHGDPDPALVGAVHLALGELKQARKVLEAAREAGDDRKEVAGPLIRVLVEQGDIARAAAVALDIVEQLSEDDARRMAEIAFERGAFDWSARLYEAIFRRAGLSEDAYGAARASAKDGNRDRAIELLRRAVEAGFSDRTRAWSDSALEALRGAELEAVLPRP